MIEVLLNRKMRNLGSESRRSSLRFSRKGLAWLVHLYTAMGLVASAGVAVAIVRGTPEALLAAFVGLWVAMVIDATDGMMARRLAVKSTLPGFDGRRLDDLTDFLTYTCLPLLLIWRAGLVPTAAAPALLIPLLASAYGFCQTDIKTNDGYFLGFPSYWNVVALYLYFLRPAPSLSLVILLILAALTFVPTRYLYPSQSGTWINRLANWLGAVWAVYWAALFRILARNIVPGRVIQGPIRFAILISLGYPAFYFIASWIISIRRWRSTNR